MTVTIPRVQSFVIANARVASALVEGTILGAASDGLAGCDIVLKDGRVAAIVASGDGAETTGEAAGSDLPRIDVGAGLVLPRFVDGHTHLDKGHIIHRAPNPDGTFLGARTTVARDREARWTQSDVRARMDFALRCAFAHGTAAVRTHIDSLGPQTAISWPVFEEIRADWKGRIELQAAALCPTELAVDDPAQFRSIVATAARYGGSIGGLTFMGTRPGEKLDSALDAVCAAARANGLGLDFHVDESASPDALTLEAVARAVIRNRYRGRVIVGHCCSLALLPDEDRRRVVGLLGEAGIAVVSLPQVNMYLQDREAGRTPRWRGVVPVHELADAGVPVTVASDNTRDPFHAYGDLDFLEVFREATRILHLDHTARDWTGLLGAVPSAAMGFETPGKIRVGAPADFVIVGARDLWELCTRPWSDRIVFVAGRRSNTTLPHFSELDGL